MKGFDMKSIAKIGKIGLAAMNRNLPSILSGAAIAGLLATAWTTYKAAPDVRSALDSAKWNKSEGDTDENVELNAWESFTAVAPHIWKPVVCGTFTVGCVIGAQVLNMQRLTMLAGAYKLSEKKLKEYEAKAKELLGEKEAGDLHDAVVKEAAEQVPMDDRFVIHTGKGKDIFLDLFSGRYFYSSTETVRSAESAINKKVANGEYVTLNDLYYELGLMAVSKGDAFGWNQYANGGNYLDIAITLDERSVGDEVQVVHILDYDVKLDPNSFR